MVTGRKIGSDSIMSKTAILASLERVKTDIIERYEKWIPIVAKDAGEQALRQNELGYALDAVNAEINFVTEKFPDTPKDLHDWVMTCGNTEGKPYEDKPFPEENLSIKNLAKNFKHAYEYHSYSYKELYEVVLTLGSQSLRRIQGYPLKDDIWHGNFVDRELEKDMIKCSTCDGTGFSKTPLNGAWCMTCNGRGLVKL